ncbi:MAG TPA: 30S ribosomal protein S8 [Vicinamibacteria bacterium]|nr:30S ribosomal protein S8 [Vicinamibacteria bacterium]
MMSDPIADMLTRIRNGMSARQETVQLPASKLKVEIARILKQEGYIEDYEKTDDDKQGVLRLVLRRSATGGGVILGLQRVSRPGCRVYVNKDGIPKVQGGMGINILSTSRGVMTGKQASSSGVGGEILCNVW